MKWIVERFSSSAAAEVYKALLDRCDAIYATIVKEDYPGDAYFPEFEFQFALSETIRATPGIRHFPLQTSSLNLRFLLIADTPFRRHADTFPVPLLPRGSSVVLCVSPR